MQDAETQIRAVFAGLWCGVRRRRRGGGDGALRLAGDDLAVGQGTRLRVSEELSENVEALINVFDEAGIKSTMPEVRGVHGRGRGCFRRCCLAAARRRA